MKKNNSVCVLMSTYNGTEYIKEQINSLLDQKGVDISIYVRDDGSCDGTQDILEEYKKLTEGRLDWYQGTNKGPARSFLELVQKAPDSQFYAFADQDDFWDDDKLLAAINKIGEEIVDIDSQACFYYSNVKVTDENLNILNISNINVEIDNLQYILLHNNAIGCTVVFNKKLLEIVRKYEPSYIKMHDWWMYQVCAALGGKIVFDKIPHIAYRQHGNNCVGFRAKKRGIKEVLFKKTECISSRMAAELLNGYKDEMEDNNRRIIEIVALYKNDWRKKINFMTEKSFFRGTGKQKLLERIAILRNRK